MSVASTRPCPRGVVVCVSTATKCAAVAENATVARAGFAVHRSGHNP